MSGRYFVEARMFSGFSPAAWASLKSLGIQFVAGALTLVTRWLTANQGTLGVYAPGVLWFWGLVVGQINAWVKSWSTASDPNTEPNDRPAVALPSEDEGDA